MINFVVCDLGHVLLTNGQSRISEETLEQILMLKQNNIQFCVATGKNYDSVAPLFEFVKDDIIYICNDGGSIIYQGELMGKTQIDRRVCFEVEKEVEKNSRFELLISGERKAYVSTSNFDFVNYLKNNGITSEQVKDVRSIHEPITKLTIYCKDGLNKEDYEFLYTKWGNSANVSASSVHAAFLTGLGVSKGVALQQIQNLFGISPEDTVVFGGGYSDIEMFKHSYYSYALHDADMEVRREAKHITLDIGTIIEDILRI